MTIRKQYNWPSSGQVNLEKLFTESINRLGISIIEGGYADDVNEFVYVDYTQEPTSGEEQLISDAIANHDPIRHKESLLDNADGTIMELFVGLGKLAPRDAAYAILGRYWKFGKEGVVDLTINDETSAKAYVSSTDEWVSLPVQVRGFIIDMMTTMVIANFVTLRLHSDKITDD